MAGLKKTDSSLGKRKAPLHDEADAASAKKLKPTEAPPATTAGNKKRKSGRDNKVSKGPDAGKRTRSPNQESATNQTPAAQPQVSLHDMIMGGYAMIEQTDATPWPQNSQGQPAPKRSRRVDHKSVHVTYGSSEESEAVGAEQGLGSDTERARPEEERGATKRKAEDEGEQSPNKRAKTAGVEADGDTEAS